MGEGGPGRILDLLVRRILAGEADVVAEGVREQKGILADQGQLGAQGSGGVCADVLPVDFKHPGVGAVETLDEIENGGFPTPGWTHQFRET
jgi:hypothetical protein